ncbi:type II toxin-antitoxin system RelE family toxin [Syntrophotalea acetylenica]|uniref:Addiction module toxin RelE n=1 Tax=Syntrophotalea acetylenica TaxID=29542 RepID=A0A1L3GID3_SYNAC|nr:type II toxin-antitoxin system RelE/ParE family toxin [Syntrophotalea acetylenica]APG25692.1 addiction module toxin RelE [Syntrophotalea acetylenica]APG43764.1 addiction module toxin RelE [Syntrophotalea acetylenica]NCB25175.1 type II toxin-antitoxin system RelE/ParE family toxin [Bacteroidia bacterium]
MSWTIEYTRTAETQLRKLDRPVARHILNYMDDKIAPLENPRTRGKALSGPLGELWRYRIGDYRVLCEIQDSIMRILVVEAGHRRQIYK